VEVAPAYDHADITSIAAADIVHEFLSMMIAPSSARAESRRSGPRDEL